MGTEAKDAKEALGASEAAAERARGRIETLLAAESPEGLSFDALKAMVEKAKEVLRVAANSFRRTEDGFESADGSVRLILYPSIAIGLYKLRAYSVPKALHPYILGRTEAGKLLYSGCSDKDKMMEALATMLQDTGKRIIT